MAQVQPDAGAGAGAAASAGDGAGGGAGGGCCPRLHAWLWEKYDYACMEAYACCDTCVPAKVATQVVRGVIAAYAVITTFINWGVREQAYKIPFELTHWGATMTMMYFVLATVLPVMTGDTAKKAAPDQAANHACCGGTKMYILQQMHFILYELAFLFEFVITALYWVALYDWNRAIDFDWWLSVNVHLFLFVFLIIETFVTRVKIVIRHLLVCYILAALYMFLNAMYTAADEQIYSVLPWNDVMSYVWTAAAFIAVFLAFGFSRGLAALRDKCLPGTAQPSAVDVAPGIEMA